MIKPAISKTNTVSIVRSFFNFLCLEVQMMDSSQPQDKIAEMIRIDQQHFNDEERVNFNIVQCDSKDSMRKIIIDTLIDKEYFKMASMQSKR